MFTTSPFYTAIALSLLSLATTPAHPTEEPITRLACGSCYKPHYRSADVWPTIATTKPQLFLFMGDNVYADTHDMAKSRATYQKLLTHPTYAAFAKEHKILPVWDDHDYGINDAGSEFPERAESQKNFQDAFNFPADHPARQTPGIYYTHTQGPAGKRLQVINLDTRYFRSPHGPKGMGKNKKYHPATGPKATLLGDAQWSWLEAELRKPADLRLIVSSIQVITVDHPYEKWANFPDERQKLIDLLKKTAASNVILLSGDRHLAEFSLLPQKESGLSYDLLEMTSSGLTHAGAPDNGNSHRVEGSYYRGTNFGTINIDWKKSSPPEVTLAIHNAKNGKIFKQITVNLPKPE